MYKIYINESELILCKSKHKESLTKEVNPDLIMLYQNQQKTLLNYVDMLEKSLNRKAILVHSPQFNSLKNDFDELFNVIPASGGLIINEKNEILFIFRRDSWDLPKGKMDPGESKKETALREVIEETGIRNVQIITKLGKTYHLFRTRSRKRAIKKSTWYLMHTKKQPLIPQTEEDIEIATWMTKEKFFSEKRIVYRSIIEVLHKLPENATTNES